MHTPLETLGSGSMVVFELRDVQVQYQFTRRFMRPLAFWGGLLTFNVDPRPS